VKRFLGIFLLFFAVGFLAREAVSLGIFRHLDVRYVAFVELLCIPAFQAAVLVLLSRRRGRPARTFASNLARRPALLAILAAEVLVVALGWLPPGRPILALGAPKSAPAIAVAVAVTALAAAAALLAALPRLRRGRAALVLLALSLAVWAADAFTGFLAHAPARLFPRMHVLVRLVTVLGGMLAVALALMLGAASVARARRSSSAFLFEAAAAFTFVSALIVVLSFYNHPWLDQPWLSIEKSGSYLALTSVLLGSVALLGDAKAAG
jgi:hypothetical protein